MLLKVVQTKKTNALPWICICECKSIMRVSEIPILRSDYCLQPMLAPVAQWSFLFLLVAVFIWCRIRAVTIKQMERKEGRKRRV